MIHIWLLTPKDSAPIVFALCREHGRELRKREGEYTAQGFSLAVVRNDLTITRLRRKAGGSRHLRACVECGRDSGTLATFVRGSLGFDLNAEGNA